MPRWRRCGAPRGAGSSGASWASKNAVRSLNAGEVPVLVALMALRSLPALLRGRRRRPRRGTIIDGFLRGGFVTLAERPHELVVGVVGRFWRVSAEVRRVSAGDFAAFREPGYAKA